MKKTKTQDRVYCQDCRFSAFRKDLIKMSTSDSRVYDCRIYPPKMRKSGGEKWPQVRPYDFCGRGEQCEEAEAQT